MSFAGCAWCAKNLTPIRQLPDFPLSLRRGGFAFGGVNWGAVSGERSVYASLRRTSQPSAKKKGTAESAEGGGRRAKSEPPSPLPDP